MDINSFISNINQQGISYSSDYEVLITRSDGSTATDEHDLVMRCSDVTQPGRGVSTTIASYYGVPSHVAKDSNFGNLSMNFILSEDQREKEYFESWIDDIVGPYRLGTTSNMFDLKFQKTYVGTVVIRKLSPTDDVLNETTYFEAFPIGIGDINMSWQRTDILYLPVSFSYRYYRNEETDI